TPGKDISVAYCPERVLPGQILRELKTNARIVGGITESCAQKVADFYRAIVDAPIHQTLATIAETSKLVENSYRDVNIAFANEVSLFCAELGIDHREVIKLANHHPRVKILNPGPGVGGHCIAVDPWFLVEAAPNTTHLIRTAREVNLTKTRYVVETIRAAVAKRFKESGKFQTIVLYGMAYKPNVADFRESPAVEVYHDLTRSLGNMASVLAIDPHLNAESAAQISINLAPSEHAKEATPLRVMLVRHRDFEPFLKSMDLDFSV
ncbi:MAG: nucleotide sugar dehydrogenase, partial [Bdellovibrionota bacterium]